MCPTLENMGDHGVGCGSRASRTRLLSDNAGVESSEPCRTSRTDRRVVALPHPLWEGTTKAYAPQISRWCRLPLVICPSLQPDFESAELVEIERNVPALSPKLAMPTHGVRACWYSIAQNTCKTHLMDI